MLSRCQCLADLVDGRVKSKRHADLALVEHDGCGLVDRVPTAIEFAAVLVELLLVELLEKLCDVSDRLLSLV